VTRWRRRFHDQAVAEGCRLPPTAGDALLSAVANLILKALSAATGKSLALAFFGSVPIGADLSGLGHFRIGRSDTAGTVVRLAGIEVVQKSTSCDDEDQDESERQRNRPCWRGSAITSPSKQTRMEQLS
jgi:hypothetical protein